MSVDQIGVNLPHDPATRLKIKNGIDELVSSMIRADAEKELSKDIYKTLKEDTKIPTKTLRRWAKWKYHDNKDREIGVITDEEAAFDILYNISADDPDADEEE